MRAAETEACEVTWPVQGHIAQSRRGGEVGSRRPLRVSTQDWPRWWGEREGVSGLEPGRWLEQDPPLGVPLAQAGGSAWKQEVSLS